MVSPVACLLLPAAMIHHRVVTPLRRVVTLMKIAVPLTHTHAGTTEALTDVETHRDPMIQADVIELKMINFDLHK